MRQSGNWVDRPFCGGVRCRVPPGSLSRRVVDPAAVQLEQVVPAAPHFGCICVEARILKMTAGFQICKKASRAVPLWGSV